MSRDQFRSPLLEEEKKLLESADKYLRHQCRPAILGDPELLETVLTLKMVINGDLKEEVKKAAVLASKLDKTGKKEEASLISRLVHSAAQALKRKGIQMSWEERKEREISKGVKS